MQEHPKHEACKRSAGCKHCRVTAPLSSGSKGDSAAVMSYASPPMSSHANQLALQVHMRCVPWC